METKNLPCFYSLVSGLNVNFEVNDFPTRTTPTVCYLNLSSGLEFDKQPIPKYLNSTTSSLPQLLPSIFSNDSGNPSNTRLFQTLAQQQQHRSTSVNKINSHPLHIDASSSSSKLSEDNETNSNDRSNQISTQVSTQKSSVYRSTTNSKTSTSSSSKTVPSSKIKCEWEGCSQLFTLKRNMRSHMKLHTGEKPFLCGFGKCDRAFATSGNLKAHRRTHTGERPFICDYEGCGKSFVEDGSLRKHIRTHTGEKPYVCEDCGKQFSQSCHLKRHYLTHKSRG